MPVFIPQKSFSSVQVRHTTNKVSPDLQFSTERSAFGVPLETLVQDTKQCGVPSLVTQMVEYLEVFGKFIFLLLGFWKVIFLV